MSWLFLTAITLSINYKEIKAIKLSSIHIYEKYAILSVIPHHDGNVKCVAGASLPKKGVFLSLAQRFS